MIVDAEKKLSRQLRLFRKRTAASREAWGRGRRFLPGGVSGEDFFFRPYPVQIEHASGAMIFDFDRNAYIDYNMASGSLILGHGNKSVHQAIEDTMDTYGTSVAGVPNPLELQLATEISDMVRSAERVRFTSSGTEANMLAVRLAMARGKRSKVGKFEGYYHGSFDYGLISSSTPRGEWGPVGSPYPYSGSRDVKEHSLYSTVVMPFNRLDETSSLIRRNRRELACVIMEPMGSGCRPAGREFIRGVREVTEKYDIPLILDEITTGFRIGLGGAQEKYGITPDLTTLGKILGGGLPVGAVAGLKEHMELLVPERKEGEGVYHAGTYNGNSFAMAAGLATLHQLRKGGVYIYLDKIAQTIKKEIDGLEQTYGLRAQVLGMSSMINVVFTRGKILNYRDMFKSDSRARMLFDFCLVNRGIFLFPGRPAYISTSITKPDLAKTLETIESSFDYMASSAA